MAQMRSRREQVDAHKFITSRMNQALVLANPDSVERPLRRIGVSIFVSVMIMVLVFGGFAIAALLGKGNEEPVVGNIIVVKGTSAVYVYTTQDGQEATDDNPAMLWPVHNYTSALLLAQPGDNGMPTVQNLKLSSLEDRPRGFTVGIPGAPSIPPGKEDLLQNENWNACSMPSEPGSDPHLYLTQLVVADMTGGQKLGTEQWMLAKTAVHEETEEPDYFLLWNDLKFEIPDLDLLNLQRADAVPINENVMNTISPGPPLAAKTSDYEYFGTPSEVESEGQFLYFGQTVEASGSYFVLMQDGGEAQFAPISETDVTLLEGAGIENTGDRLPVQSSVVSGTGSQAQYRADSESFPQGVQELWTARPEQSAVCAVFDPATSAEEAKVEINLYDSAPSTLTTRAKEITLDENGEIISNIAGQTAQTVLPAGTAALVKSQSSPGQSFEMATYLIDDRGYRFGIVDHEITGSTKKMLGYDGVTSTGVPQVMLDLIPKGADLDPEDAKKEQNPDAEVPEYDTGGDPAADDGTGGSEGESEGAEGESPAADEGGE
ncbi:type VII secretion protein EccB [Glycomyces buryatensis]|uniref:Type VII secretion protein EccB n=1 Tax=Glycomyces buryatensis TaxID=2570927 RepID=A0A4S8QHF9_9ACTN|nr:type VII secretion protein EccB [Glycomyces buryatensis]THV42395.1 type VII secretion protein EccB [Glycomyces buryatensis]